MVTPLYNELQKQELEIDKYGNCGLWFERFADFYESDFRILKKKIIDKKEENPGSAWLKKHFNNKKVGDEKRLTSHAQAQTQLAESLQGKSLVFKASWHFVTGMGNPHPVENGFAWHPTFGVPYLTGAAVKGLIRTFIETQLDETDSENPDKKKLLLQWFGSTDKDPMSEGYQAQAGELIFFDALPIEPVTLGVDIMTPHMGKWYEKGGDITDLARQPEAVPADWHDPVPVSFLVAKDITLLFSFAMRPHPTAKQEPFRQLDLTEVEQALTAVLEQMGAGGKTATGYGGMQPLDSKSTVSTTQKSEERWEKSTFQYNKGSGEIIAVGNKKRASIKGDAAKQLLEKLGDKRKLLEKNKLTAIAIVHSQGNLHELLDIK